MSQSDRFKTLSTIIAGRGVQPVPVIRWPQQDVLRVKFFGYQPTRGTAGFRTSEPHRRFAMRHTHSKVPLPGRTTLHFRSRTLHLSQVENRNNAVSMLLDDSAHVSTCPGRPPNDYSPQERLTDVAREGSAEAHTRA